jgi:hypothetical protein
MIVNEMWNGSGLGNQLACYVTTRCIALDKGYDFGIIHPERFKGYNFLKNVYFGKPVIGGFTAVEGKPPNELPEGITNYYVEKSTWLPNGSNVSSYDPDLLAIPDNTKIDGLMQGEDYFKMHKEKIREWLKIDPIQLPEDLCIINFRGGEYAGVSDFFLRKKYWDDAMNNMMSIKKDIRFMVVTDDVVTARRFFDPTIYVTHDIANDYRSIQSAHYLILSNSSFAFFPAWLNINVKYCIAPRYWGRHNISNGYWSLDQNYTEGWLYQDREGNLGYEK